MEQEAALPPEERGEVGGVDLEAAEATCPACGEAFDPGGLSAGGGRCPGCGLRLG